MTTTTSTDQYASTDSSTTEAAAEEGRRVADVAKDEVGNVAVEAKDQAAELLEQAKSQLSEQGSTQRDRLVQTLTTLGNDLEQMAQRSDHSGMATDLVRQAAGRARALGDRLDGREPTQILDDVRAYARRRPGTFLLGALAAGILAGRLTRGAKESKSSDSQQASGQVTGTPVTPAAGATGGGVHAAGTSGPDVAYAGGGGVGDSATAPSEVTAPSEPLRSTETSLTPDGGSVGRDLPDDRGVL
jgi:hypothetical protein